MPKAIVTGSSGFIGSHLVKRLLKDGWEVIGIDDHSRGRKEKANPDCLNYELSLEDMELGAVPELDGADAVFHLAAWARVQQSFGDPKTYFRKNVMATENILRLSAAARVKRFLFASSSSVYGDVPIPKLGTDETAPRNPRSPYAANKAIGEMLVEEYARLHHLPALSLRFFNVYGPDMADGQYATVIQTFLGQKKRGEPFTVRGDGKQKRDFTHVTDIVNALVMAANLSNEFWQVTFDGRQVNLGAGDNRSVLQVAAAIDPIHPIEHVNGVPEPKETLADNRKAYANLGWKPLVGFEDGIKELL